MKDFKSLKLNDVIINSLSKIGIKNPTPIQEQVIPIIFEKKDLIAKSPTGSGKTLAYLLAIIQDIKNCSQVLILVPTRELAIQIENEARKVSKDISILSIYGGREIAGQLSQLKEKPQIIISTTGRLIDIIKREGIDFKNIKQLVLDEVDQMFEMGFKEDIEFIRAKLNKKLHTLCFSATIDSKIKKLLYKITSSPIYVEIDEKNNPLNSIEQFFIPTTDRRKIDHLSLLLNEVNPFLAIIFCRTKARVDKLEKELTLRGYSCQKIHSDLPQTKREKIIKAFRDVEFQLLIATDVIARGVDILGVTHIFNYDAPEDIETYIHRVGRTGRAGDKGKSYLFITEKNEDIFQELSNFEDISLNKLEIEYIPNTFSTLELPDKKYRKKINTNTKNIEKMKNRFRK